MDKLRAMEYFVQTVEAGSMSAAARQLEVSPPAVTKLIAALERELGTTLLRRDSRRLLLTPDGDAYLKTCQRILAELHETEAALATQRLRVQGRLVVGVSRTVAQHCLVPRLEGFTRLHPELEIEFRNVNYAHEALAALCDVLVLIGWQEDGDWVARRLARGRHSVVATPAFWKRHGEPKRPEDLVRYPCMAFRVPRGVVLDRWRFTRGEERCEVEPRAAMVFDDRDCAVEAVLAGHGMHFGNDITLLPWLRDGRLQVVLREWVGHDTPPVHYMYRPGARASAAVRGFGDFVGAVFEQMMRERERFGPADTSDMPEWFRSNYVGRLTARRGDGAVPTSPATRTRRRS
jgi:LysR family transcriptional activator of dmlA